MNMQQFACPQMPGNEQITASIAAAHGAGAVEMLLERSRDAHGRRSHGLAEFLQAWLATAMDFETVWDLGFGRALRALETDEVDAVDVLAEVALWLAARGQPGRWTAPLRAQRRLCWDNTWLLPEASDISVETDGVAATVALTLRDGGRWTDTLRRDRQGWHAEKAARLTQVGTSRPITLFPSYAVPHDMIVEDDFHSIFEFPPITPDIAQPYSAALDILTRHAPEYLGWVNRVLRGIVACRCKESRTRSSSWMHAPGIILVSWSSNPVEVAEMLVHESSHQYYYLVSRLGPVVGSNDTQQYYSPAVQRSRPLSKILLGYHAFANVLLFYRALLRNGLADDPYCSSMEARLSGEVETLEQPLRDNPDLTAIGLDLCRPLMEQLHELDRVR